MALTQSLAARYFDQVNDDSGINEVLSAYVMSKFVNGSEPGEVLYKMHLLCCYLRANGREHVLEIGLKAFKAIAFEVAIGGDRIGATAIASKAGIKAWNRVREQARKKGYPIVTHELWGGSGTIVAMFPPEQFAKLRRLKDPSERPTWLEAYYNTRCRMIETGVGWMPGYESELQTLPAYVSQDNIEAVERVFCSATGYRPSNAN
ncbi:hypothetical protein CYLTODRAFT_458172 [Cylindrobasidium torrendii FP15055 ss-10]|uniref:Uncharacterized protein n=1 Tax=Cylindrobasidium torrendii FP15055 ss-10 TaxID=1314674 RepID=A0A0D7AYC3_9AGAR|nr:hypothetical protein CYLTODRAFT_458172 [Cylindrobasidium torrendii FP15055 ss-10]